VPFGGGTPPLGQFGDLAQMFGTQTLAAPRRPGHFRIADLTRSLLPGFRPGRLHRVGGDARRSHDPLGRIGPLEVRLAQTLGDIHEAQRLRFKVFYGEMSATPDLVTSVARRDKDRFDGTCEHLLVTDHSRTTKFTRRSPVVGTYRLLRQEIAERGGGFYSDDEFAVSELAARHAGLRFLELGRSCVLPSYRNKRTVELLWQGIWAYVQHHRMDVMIGCASLEGTDPDRLAVPLSFLHHYARAPEEWRTSARTSRYVEMKRLPKSAIDAKAALRFLPPLIKGYLRLGAYVGDGAVIDRQFGTTDVLIVLPVAAIHGRYIDHFGGLAASRAA
jgi:L-ornithine Nalpha-acyltransferase